MIKHRRNGRLTRNRILDTATQEFSIKGLEGARVDEIALRSGSNKNMIYHYFASKDGLFEAVLVRMYSTIRSRQSVVEIENLTPTDGMRSLVDFTFNVFYEHPEFISLLTSENLVKAKHVRASGLIMEMYNPLTATIEKLLALGAAEGVFRAGIMPVDVYISLSAIASYHISNRHTLSAIFGTDINSATHREQRRAHVAEMILCYLKK
jgi:AcrR family transcriptional regulator